MRMPIQFVAMMLAGLAPQAASCVTAKLVATAGAMPPTVSGSAGPYARVAVTVTVSKAAGDRVDYFKGVVSLPDGRRLALPPPDEPADFFYLEPKAVLFTPIDRTPANAIIILYDSSQIGPQHGTDHRALVYRITAKDALRQSDIEERLDGVATAAAARTRLRKMR